MSQRADLKLDKGTDFQCLFLCSTCNGKVDFGGYSAAMHLKQNPYGKAIDVLTTENGRLVLDRENGAISATFPDEITATYPVCALLYDVKLKSADGYVFRLVHGRIQVNEEITRL